MVLGFMVLIVGMCESSIPLNHIKGTRLQGLTFLPTKLFSELSKVYKNNESVVEGPAKLTQILKTLHI